MRSIVKESAVEWKERYLYEDMIARDMERKDVLQMWESMRVRTGPERASYL